ARHVGVSINPKAVWKFGNLDLSAGVRLDMVSPAGNASGQYSRTGQIIYPDVRASYTFLDGALTAYASLTGGARGVSWREARSRNHFLRPVLDAGGVLDNEIVRMDAEAGLRGTITQWFNYDFSAGYAFLSGAMADLVVRTAPAVFYQSLAYVDEGLFHADLSGNLDLENFSAEGTLSFRKAKVDAGTPMVLPSPFSADVRLGYGWADRLETWIGVRAALARKAIVADIAGGSLSATPEMTVPGYADVSLGAEYALTRRWKVWGRIGNLLNSDVRILPVHVRRGINFTAGICLEL
ncbi:MAG: TonB-dependent receptor, partial [Bacteroidales bacterium]|nr:TonB-dependent receptor [Bacteroidales bacterium]